MRNTHVETPFSNTCLITENMSFFQQDNAACHITNHVQHLLSTVDKNLILNTVLETETVGPTLASKWNSDDRCPACCHTEWSDRIVE